MHVYKRKNETLETIFLLLMDAKMDMDLYIWTLQLLRFGNYNHQIFILIHD